MNLTSLYALTLTGVAVSALAGCSPPPESAMPEVNEANCKNRALRESLPKGIKQDFARLCRHTIRKPSPPASAAS